MLLNPAIKITPDKIKFKQNQPEKANTGIG